MKPHLLLIVPPQLGLLEGFANGVISLSNYVQQQLQDLQIQLLDLSNASPEEVEDTAQKVIIQSKEPLLVGITTTTATYQSALEVARVFRRRRRDSTIVLGGCHASAQADVILKAHAGLINVIAHGEGEIALLKLVQEFSNPCSVPGISYLNEMGEIKRNPSATLLSEVELDAIHPTLDRGSLRSAPGKFDHVTYVSARGCPLKCAFCSVANQKIRSKSVAAIVQDIRHFVGELGYRNIAIEDNFFAHSCQRTIELCKALEKLKSELDFTWDCQTRVESLDRGGILSAMERAGCVAIYLGVESLNNEQLLYLGKTKNPGRYLKALKRHVVPDLLTSQVDCYLNLQLGLPGENENHRKETLDHLHSMGRMAEKLEREITIFPNLHVVYPGTRHFTDGVAHGRFGVDGHRIFEKFTRWEAEQKLIRKWLGEHFAHGVGGIPEGILFTDQLRDGNFQVDTSRVLDVVNYLSSMEQIPGIKVFKYGAYLAKSHQSDFRLHESDKYLEAD